MVVAEKSGIATAMKRILAAALLLCVSAALHAESSRETLTQTVFSARDRAAALAQIAAIESAAAAALSRAPNDSETQMTRALAVSYRAKLTHSRSDALIAKAQFEALANKYPRDAEAQAALGAWHLNAVEALGGIVARGALGARKATGLELTDRAIALGGDRALFPALAGLLRLALDPKDARGIALLDVAAHGSTPTLLDRQLQRRAAQLATVAKGGDAKLTQALAHRLLPLGQFK